MEALLQQQQIPDLSSTMGTLALMWAAWPVICGLLGARRGQAMKGAITGLMWGPIGILIILFTPVKYCCPTCGQKTLKQPHIALPGIPRTVEMSMGCDPASQARPTSADLEELARLQAWVNGEAPMTWPSRPRQPQAGELVAAD